MTAYSLTPWSVHVRKDGGRCILDADRRVIALMKDIHNDSERAANARLIFAAPAMLDMLRLFYEAEIFSGDDEEALETLIIKATGGPSA